MRNATLLAAAAVLAFAVPASAQCTGTAGTDFSRVTVREINTIPQSQIDQLNAAGADLEFADIAPLIASPFATQRVEFSAVILTNPLLSGLGSPNAQGVPNRYHVFARDAAAATEGVAGMGIQIVDERGDGAIQSFFVGDEVTVCGQVTYFNNTLQLAPESISSNSNPRGADDPILDPVVITTDDIHQSFVVEGTDRSQIDWDTFSDFNNQYVRFETIELVQGVAGVATGRPNMLFSTTGDATSIRSYDTSVCYRNDRDASYFPANQEPVCNLTDFVPPPSGTVNVQGFLTISGEFDAFASTVPSGGAFAISPFEDSDFEIAVSPPIISLQNTGIPSPSAGAVVTATVTPGTAGNTVASVVTDFTTTAGGSGQVTLANTSGDTYSGTISGLAAGTFVTYTVTATDNQNNASQTSRTFRVVDGPVASIFDVQVTPTGGEGDSGLITTEPVPFDLDAVVQTAYVTGTRFQATIQDDPTLGPFSAVLLDFGTTDPGLSVGDRITISQARVSEFRNLTQLVDVTFTTTGSGEAYAPKLVTTALFAGAAGAEAGEQHESMRLRFEGGTITSANPDGDAGNFGEFAFSTDGTAANQLRADDASNGVASPDADGVGGFNSTLRVGQSVVSIEGYLSYSFGAYKLIPITEGDVVLGGTAVGTGPEDSAVGIVGSFPNPTTGAARVRFELAAPGKVSLRVFDAMGRQVATVAEGTYSASTHDATVELGGLAAGVYVLRLEAGGEVATARIAVVR